MDKLSSLFFEDTEDDDIQLLHSAVSDLVQGASAPSGFADDYYTSGEQGQLVSDGSTSFPEKDSSLALGMVGFTNVDLASVDLVKRIKPDLCSVMHTTVCLYCTLQSHSVLLYCGRKLYMCVVRIQARVSR